MVSSSVICNCETAWGSNAAFAELQDPKCLYGSHHWPKSFLLGNPWSDFSIFFFFLIMSQNKNTRACKEKGHSISVPSPTPLWFIPSPSTGWDVVSSGWNHSVQRGTRHQLSFIKAQSLTVYMRYIYFNIHFH